VRPTYRPRMVLSRLAVAMAGLGAAPGRRLPLLLLLLLPGTVQQAAEKGKMQRACCRC